MARTKKIFCCFSIVLILALVTFSVGCAVDLGTFSEDNDFEEYYESFGDVVGLFDGGQLSYNVKNSLLNEHTTNDLDWEKDEYEVQSKQYVYVIIPFKAAMKLESIAFYIKAETDCELHISAFYFINDFGTPKRIKYLSSPDTEIIIVDEEPVEVEIVYDDPLTADRICGVTASLSKGEWSSFILNGFHQQGYEDEYLHTGDNGLLYIRMENNSGLNKSTMPPCQFTFLNMLVRKL